MAGQLTDTDWKKIQSVALTKLTGEEWIEEQGPSSADLAGVPADYVAVDGTEYSVMVVVTVTPHPKGNGEGTHMRS